MVRGKSNVIHPRIERAISKIGSDISHARRSRKIAADDFASRIGISRATLHRLENGDPGIALSTLAMALHAIGRLDALAEIADPSVDNVTMMEMKDNTPKRISKPRRTRSIVNEDNISQEADDGPSYDETKFVGF